MNILNYKREDIKKLVQDGVCPFQSLRDYDILKDLQDGKKIDDIMSEHRIGKTQIFAIRKKYMPR